MSMIKTVLKKLFIAGLTGAIILALVYVKDNYLEQGDQDSEILNEITFSEDKSAQTVAQNNFVIEVENVEDIQENKDLVATNSPSKTILKEKVTETKIEQDFDKFKESMNIHSTADAAFDELERESNQ